MLFSVEKDEAQNSAATGQSAASAQSILTSEVIQQLGRFYQSPQTAPEIIDTLLRFAVDRKVSDILIEPATEYTLVRMRLDGVLQEATRIPRAIYAAVASRIKVLSNLDTTSRSAVLEGKFLFTQESRTINVRVAITIVAGGEMVALRIHDSANSVMKLSEHGMSEATSTAYMSLLKLKTGLILVCGPTGAGKTSTLYSSLQVLNTGNSNIISIEDPVEYVMQGINQMQVDHDRDLTFASGLRVILRLNPDIIFVGEVRDQETAQIGIEAALTGHLVLTTLHANSAVSAISRLRDLEIEKFFINASLKGVLCQRLVRLTCKQCGQWQAPSSDEQEIFQQVLGHPLEKQFVGKGCEACAGTGFQGRIGVFELVVVDEVVRTLISHTVSEQEMFMELRKYGFVSLIEDGMAKVEQGLTTLTEVLTNVSQE